MKIPPELMHKLCAILDEIFEANFFKGSSTGVQSDKTPFINPMKTIVEPSALGDDRGGSRGGGRKPRQQENDSLNKTASNEIFHKFYVEYPKHVGRGVAIRALDKALKKVNIEIIVAEAKRYAEYCRKEGIGRRYIANPATWLNQERWADEYGTTEHPDTIRARIENFKRWVAKAEKGHDAAHLRALKEHLASDIKKLEDVLHKDSVE